MKVQIDLSLSLARAATALDVEDVRAVEDGHVHRMAGRVREILEVGRRDLAELHRVDRGEPEIEHPEAEPVAPGRPVLLEIAEVRKRRDVAVGARTAEPDLAREVTHAEEWAGRGERGKDREAAFEGLRGGGFAGGGDCAHTGVLAIGTPS